MFFDVEGIPATDTELTETAKSMPPALAKCLMNNYRAGFR